MHENISEHRCANATTCGKPQGEPKIKAWADGQVAKRVRVTSNEATRQALVSLLSVNGGNNELGVKFVRDGRKPSRLECKISGFQSWPWL